MWESIKASCFRSLTIAWAYVLGIFGVVLGSVDQIGILINDPTITQKVTDLLHADPRAMAAFSLLVSGVTIITRSRTLLKKPS